MTDTLRQLAAARVAMQSAKRQLAVQEATLEQSALYRAVVLARDWVRASQQDVDELTDQVRAEALAAFQETGNKQPWPGVQIKMYSKIEFSEEEARAWCFDYAGSLLKLDTRAFQRAAPALPDAPITITKEPRATIASDLSMYQKEKEATDDLLSV